MIGETQEVEADLLLRVHEDKPFWRWAWLDLDSRVVSEGVAFSQAGACKVAGTVLEILQTLAAQGDSAAPLSPGWALTVPQLDR